MGNSIDISNKFQNIDFKYDYFDIYKTEFKNEKLDVEKLINNFQKMSNNQPKWIKILMIIRNKIASLFGLKTTQLEKPTTPKNIKIGEKLGLFQLFGITDNGIILGKNDKHLNFRLLVFYNEISKSIQIINFATLVKFNNQFGKFYFSLIKPFHKIIVKKMARNFG